MGDIMSHFSSKDIYISISKLWMGCDQSSDVKKPRKINTANRTMFNSSFGDTPLQSQTFNVEGNFFDPIIPIFDEIESSENARKEFYCSLSQMIG